MKWVKTFTATIYVGLRERYSNQVHEVQEAQAVCQRYVDEIGFCVSFTETKYLYTSGAEPGIIVGIIHYPRFPSTIRELRRRSLRLAHELRIAMGQFKVCVVFPTRTVMLEARP